MKRFGIPKIVLLATSLSLSACKTVDEAPEHWLCQYNGTPRAFYCVNSVSKERVKVPADSAGMKAAQCLSANDYLAMQGYIKYLIGEASRRCQ